MIVTARFEGDDTALGWQQHDVYGDALRIIVRGCRQHFLDACLIAGGDANRWPDGLAIDHRVVQDMHDTAAAAWRWRVAPGQTDLFSTSDSATMTAWLKWLAIEVGSWRERPALVLNVTAMILHQNAAVGYAGELRMQQALAERYADVPWNNRSEI